MTKEKAKLYTTARATISCYHFKKDSWVSVKYEFTAENGIHWFLCNNVVMYPDKHLTRFVI